MRALAVPQVAKVILTYNTRGDDVSGVLRFLEEKREEDPRRLVLLSQADSTSKATNLNRALPLVARCPDVRVAAAALQSDVAVRYVDIFEALVHQGWSRQPRRELDAD